MGSDCFRRTILLSLVTASLVVAPAAVADRAAPGGPSTVADHQASWDAHQALEASSPFAGLTWRSVGPVRQGGRVVDIAAIPGAPYSFYVAYASGGLWKTLNNGGTFEPLFDFQSTIIMGDVAVDPNRPETVWVGTGENNSSRSSYGGLGVFRSDDGGVTWTHKGLDDTDRIGRIVIDPRDGERVYVAALGKLYTQGGGRGVYRSIDGGTTWQQVLEGEGWTGFVDLVMDPSDPDVLYAASWERSRRPWDFVEGGEGSGIWKSSDGGDTWQRLGGGLPRGAHVGRIGIAIAASRPQTVYASIDNQEELPEEEWDLGDSPLSANRLRTMTEEQFLEYDPQTIEGFVRRNDLDTSLDAKQLIRMIKDGELTMDELREELSDANANLFNTNIRGLELWRSDDGGVTWQRTHAEPIRGVTFTYGYYFGKIAVAPDDPDRVYLVGVPLIASSDGGATFESLQRRDVHVDYHPVWVDPSFPDRLLIGNDGGVDVSYDDGQTFFGMDAQPVGQFYAITLDNAKPYNIYGGLQDNGSLKGSSRSRWQLGDAWTFIGGGDGMYVQVDPRNDQTTYAGFQFGFYNRSGPEGRGTVRPRDNIKEPALRYNWQTPIQLSSHNADIVYFGTQSLYRSMDKGETWTAISPDLTRSTVRGDVPFASITTLEESTEVFGLIWVGTDDGYVHVTEDGGVTWSEVSAGLPRDRWVSRVVASRWARDTAYVTLNGYRDDDITAYIYRTTDLGKTWTSIADGLPSEAVNVIREDPVNESVLYVGTDRGVYVSLDGASSWLALQGGLPNVPVHDLAVHRRDRELVAGTHGRSVWVVDVLPVQELKAVEDEALHVFPLEDVQASRGWRGRVSKWFDYSDFAPEVTVPFWSAAEGDGALVVVDGDERELVRRPLSLKPGINTVVWDLLVERDKALAAEAAALADAEGEEEPKKKRRGKRGKKKSEGEEDEPATTEARRAKTPYAEGARLEWQPYIEPGTYTVRIEMGEASAGAELKIKAPEPPQPRTQKEEPIRGREEDDEHG